MRTVYFFLATAVSAVSVNAGRLPIDFEMVPVGTQGSSLLASAGPAQAIVVPNVATITGGFILGDGTNLSARAFGTAPNVYRIATAPLIPGTDPSLQSTLSLPLIPLLGTVTEVASHAPASIANGRDISIGSVALRESLQTAVDGVPEPGTLGLLGVGLVIGGLLKRRRKKSE